MERNINQEIGNFMSVNNKIEIKNTNLKEIKWISFPDGTQSGSLGKVDTIYNYKTIKVQDSFFVSNVLLSYSLPDAENQIYNSSIFGQNSTFALVDNTNLNHRRPNAKRLEVNFKSENLMEKVQISPFVFTPNSKQSISVKSNTASEILVFDYNYFYSLYNLNNVGDLKINVLLTYQNNENKSFKFQSSLILDNENRVFVFEDDKNNLNKMDASSNSGQISKLRSVKTDLFPNFILINGEGIKKEAKFVIENTKDIKNYRLEVTMDRSNTKVNNIKDFYSIFNFSENKKWVEYIGTKY